jgi:hypothetical protein
MSTFGPAYDRNIDEPALNDQREAIKRWMLSVPRLWMTLQELSGDLGFPEASISAQLRHLRKEAFGGYNVQKRRRRGQRVWEYNIQPPVAKDAPAQMLLVPEPRHDPMGTH